MASDAIEWIPVARWRILRLPIVLMGMVVAAYVVVAVTAIVRGVGDFPGLLLAFGVTTAFWLVLVGLSFWRKWTTGFGPSALGLCARGLVVVLPRSGQKVVSWDTIRAGWIATRAGSEHICFALTAKPAYQQRGPWLALSDSPLQLAIFRPWLDIAPSTLDAKIRAASAGRVTLLPSIPPRQTTPHVRQAAPEAVTLDRTNWEVLRGPLFSLLFFVMAVAAFLTAMAGTAWLFGVALVCMVIAAGVWSTKRIREFRRLRLARLTHDGIDVTVGADSYSVHLPWPCIREAKIVTAPARLLSRRPVRAVAFTVDDWEPTDGPPFVDDQAPWLARVRSELEADAAIAVRRDRDLDAVRAAISRFTDGRLTLSSTSARRV